MICLKHPKQTSTEGAQNASRPKHPDEFAYTFQFGTILVCAARNASGEIKHPPKTTLNTPRRRNASPNPHQRAVPTLLRSL